MKNVLTIAALAALIAAPVLAEDAAKPKPNPDSPKQGGKLLSGQQIRGPYAKLQGILTAEQKIQFQSIMQASRKEGKPLYEKMRTMREQMQSGSNMDDKTKSEFTAVRKQMKAHRQATQTKILALLTPAQKAQLDKMGGLDSGKEGFGEGRGMSKWAGGGGRRHKRDSDAQPSNAD